MSECSGPDCDHPSHNHGNPRRVDTSKMTPAGRRVTTDPHTARLLKSLKSNPDPQVSAVIDEVVEVDYAAIERRVAAQRIIDSGVHFAVSEWMARCIRERREYLEKNEKKHNTGRLKVVG